MNRRDFARGVAGVSGLMILKPGTAFSYQANSTVQIGLLGCGLRGTAVATSFIKNSPARIAALGDLFPDQISKASEYFDKLGASHGHAPIASDLKFAGADAYERIANAKGVDAIQISTPPYFHVQHLDAVVKAGKHVFCEKPLGVDVPQARRALEIGKAAQGRLSFDVGFQIRSTPVFMELARRIHEGAIGKVVTIDGHYNAPATTYPEMPSMPADELRIRRWKWDRVLSGSILVEQDIHSLDTCNWLVDAHPIKAVGRGGRDVVTHAGDNWDNFELLYTYANGAHFAFSGTQFGNRDWGFDVKERIFGTLGVAEASYSDPLKITGQNPWSSVDEKKGEQKLARDQKVFPTNGSFSGNLGMSDPEKERTFVESITSGKFHNQAEMGVNSALTAIMGRMAAETGREITWISFSSRRNASRPTSI